MNGAPEVIRTPDLQLRRLSLYPAELRARAMRLAIGNLLGELTRGLGEGDGVSEGI